MKKRLFLLIPVFLILLTSFVFAINLKIEKENTNEVAIKGINQPVIFNINITNLGSTDNFEFYNLLGLEMKPTDKVSIGNSETKKIELQITPRDDMNYEGFYIVRYFIKGRDGSQVEDSLNLEIVNLKNAFEVGAEEFNPESSSLKIYITNKKNYDFKDITGKFSSPFFAIEEKFSLFPFERKEFEVKLNKEDYKKLIAGFYTLNAELSYSTIKANTEGVIKFAEKNIVTETKKDYGIVVVTKSINKINKGNVITKSETTIKKNIISRLFTYFTPEPDLVDREGAIVYYTWTRDIKPGENFEIIVKTNWLFPVIIVLLIIAIIVIIKRISSTDIVLRKKVSFVNAKGGEFALKVSISVSSKKYTEKIRVIDRLPPLVKIYERFGVEKPIRVDEKNKRIEWNFQKLEEGETRILTYIVYSKVGIMGKFALPETTAIYEKDGKLHEVTSNRAFFVAEQRTKDLEEE